MGFHVRTHFSISHDDRENERITDPNSIYFYTDKIPKELHMRYAKGIIPDIISITLDYIFYELPSYN